MIGGDILKITNEQLKDMYLTMLKIRKFETRAMDKFAEGKIPGFVHLYIGEEAVARHYLFLFNLNFIVNYIILITIILYRSSVGNKNTSSSKRIVFNGCQNLSLCFFIQ